MNVCRRSARVQASLPRWREWTGLPFATDGEQLVDGALNPVRVELEKNLATYIEPGVWVKYSV